MSPLTAASSGIASAVDVVDLVNLVIAITVAEMAWLHWRTRRGDRAGMPWLANLLAGFGLLMALRLALADASWPWVGAALAGAGLAHLSDLRSRWRGVPVHPPPKPLTPSASPSSSLSPATLPRSAP